MLFEGRQTMFASIRVETRRKSSLKRGIYAFYFYKNICKESINQIVFFN